MLKTLQKAMGIKPQEQAAVTSAVVETLEIKLDAEQVAAFQATVDAAVAAATAEFNEFKQTAEALLANADALHAQLAAEADGLKAQVAELQAALDATTAEKAAAEAAAQAAKLQARKEKVIGIVGTERADALLVATDGMADAAFDAVVAALGTGATVEAAAPLFNEVGADAPADSAAVVETPEMKRLKAKYGDSAKRQ